MKKALNLSIAALLAVSLITLGCDDDDNACTKCVDNYCDCAKSAGEDLNAILECTVNVAECLEDKDCEESDIAEDACE
ncbi:MAG: hypothetical protein GY847_36550 [Proteobacteria bacterium]|nr:hypothetical protein [Pseudomonadota bacterium]